METSGGGAADAAGIFRLRYAGDWESRVTVVITPERIAMTTAVHWPGKRAPSVAALAIERMANGIAVDDYRALVDWLRRRHAGGASAPTRSSFATRVGRVSKAWTSAARWMDRGARRAGRRANFRRKGRGKHADP